MAPPDGGHITSRFDQASKVSGVQWVAVSGQTGCVDSEIIAPPEMAERVIAAGLTQNEIRFFRDVVIAAEGQIVKMAFD